jgi:hypothetical protein
MAWAAAFACIVAAAVCAAVALATCGEAIKAHAAIIAHMPISRNLLIVLLSYVRSWAGVRENLTGQFLGITA